MALVAWLAYVSIGYSERLAEAGIAPSVGSTGDSYDCAKYVAGKCLESQFQTLDRVGQYFRVQDGKVRSFAGLSPAQRFTKTFRNAAKGFEILSAKDGKEAFLAGLHDEDLSISGDFVEVMWFQGFTEYLKPNP
jgi:hypothetical protein